MFSIFVQNFSFIYDDHKEISLSKEIDFKIEADTLDTWASFNTDPNDSKFLSNMKSLMIYKILRVWIQKGSNKGDMIKKPNLT